MTNYEVRMTKQIRMTNDEGTTRFFVSGALGCKIELLKG
jgi:hypothetical protein